MSAPGLDDIRRWDAEDALASLLARNGVQPLCALACAVNVSGAACALLGATAAAVDLSAPGVAPAGLSFAAFGLAGGAAAPAWPARLCLSAQCSWVDAQTFSTPAVCTALPVPAAPPCSF